MFKMPRKGNVVTFRRQRKDPEVRLGKVVVTGFKAIVAETGVKGTEGVAQLFVPLNQVCCRVQ